MGEQVTDRTAAGTEIFKHQVETELIEIYEERAAIREYDGGLPRPEAERAAYFDWRRIVGRGIAAPDYIIERARLYKDATVEQL